MRAGRDCDEGNVMVQKINLEVYPFRMGTNKEAALKPLEEASELREAWSMYDEGSQPVNNHGAQIPPDSTLVNYLKTHLEDEIADTIQAACNLAARYDIDLQAAMDRCRKRNDDRGRYGSTSIVELAEFERERDEFLDNLFDELDEKYGDIGGFQAGNIVDINFEARLNGIIGIRIDNNFGIVDWSELDQFTVALTYAVARAREFRYLGYKVAE